MREGEQMTDKHAGYIVTLGENVREDDAEYIINAIRMVKGVVGVSPIVATYDLQIAMERREETPVSDPDPAIAADAWAQAHGCRDISSCCKTPREAFAAGHAKARAAERQRIVTACTKAGIRIRIDDDEDLPFSVWLDIIDGLQAAARGETTELADLLDGDDDA